VAQAVSFACSGGVSHYRTDGSRPPAGHLPAFSPCILQHPADSSARKNETFFLPTFRTEPGTEEGESCKQQRTTCMNDWITWGWWRGSARKSAWQTGETRTIPAIATWEAWEPPAPRCFSIGRISAIVTGLWCHHMLPASPSNLSWRQTCATLIAWDARWMGSTRTIRPELFAGSAHRAGQVFAVSTAHVHVDSVRRDDAARQAMARDAEERSRRPGRSGPHRHHLWLSTRPA
jgi:hypothetical protein